MHTIFWMLLEKLPDLVQDSFWGSVQNALGKHSKAKCFWEAPIILLETIQNASRKQQKCIEKAYFQRSIQNASREAFWMLRQSIQNASKKVFKMFHRKHAAYFWESISSASWELSWALLGKHPKCYWRSFLKANLRLFFSGQKCLKYEKWILRSIPKQNDSEKHP